MRRFAGLALWVVVSGCGSFGLDGRPGKDSNDDVSLSSDSGPAREEGTVGGDCRDGADNDRDGLFDCDDPGCADSPDCDETSGSSGDGDGSGSSDGGGGSGSTGGGSSGSSGGGTATGSSSGGGGSGSTGGGSGSTGGGSGSTGGGSGSTGGSSGASGGATGGSSGLVCLYTCRWDGDGVCDDGGTDSSYSACDFGTDCSDCGPRDPCTDNCTPWETSSYAGDGDCDDGAADSVSSLCDVGTDCTDCGPRAP